MRADLRSDAADLADIGPELHLRAVLLGHGEEHDGHPAKDVLDDDHVVILVQHVRWLEPGYNVAKDTVGSLPLHRGFCDSRLAKPHAQRQPARGAPLMPAIIPFRGLRYSKAAGALDRLLAPPYDVITEAMRADLAAASPYNAVHLELASGGDERYGRVAATVSAWQREGVLVRDQAPTLYAYEQRFVEGGREYARRGLFCGVEAQPWDEGAVKPHEFTMSGPKEDRLKLLEAARVQFSPVFMIARDRAGQLRQFLETAASREPDAEGTTADGDHHRLWAVEAGRTELRWLAPLLAESFYIADGHHRYETALNYRRLVEEREQKLPADHPARYAMATVVAADDPGLVIRPIHRLVPRPAPTDWEERLGGAFAVTRLELPGDSAAARRALAQALDEHPEGILALGMVEGQAHLLEPVDRASVAARAPKGASERWVSCAPNLLRYGILEPLWAISDEDLRAGAVEYTHDIAEVQAFLDAPSARCAFLIHSVGVETVMALADQGERLPQKSTFFHPKLATGLVFYPLEP